MGRRDGASGLGGKVAGFTILGLLVLLGGAYVGIALYAGETAPRNAAVEGISIAGLDADEAEQKVREGLAERERAPIRVAFGDGRGAEIDPADAGLAVDHAASVERATGGGTFGPRRIWQVLVGGRDNDAEVTVDQQKMQATLDRLNRSLGQRPVEGDIVFRSGRAIPVRSRPGTVVSRSRAQNQLEGQFLHRGSRKLPTETRDPYVDDAAVGKAMAEFARPAMSGPVTLVLAGQRVQAPPRLFGEGLSMIPDEGELVPRVDGKKMLEALEPVMTTVGTQPKDARIEVVDGRPRVIPAKVGVELDPAEIESRFADVAVQRGAQRRLAVEGKVTEPAFTTAEARAMKIKRRVSTWTTYFPYAEYRNVNLTRAAELIDGTLLRPGETFSLNKTVGERTAANGFTEGYIISDGIFKKDLGGGVSQIATTTFNAMFFAGLEDVEHKPHSVYIDRYPVGREATVAWPSVDLKFKNTTPYGVLIKASVKKSAPGGQGSATVSMYSTKRWDITSRNGPRTDVREPKTRYLQDEDCEEADGTRGFTINVFRYFHPVGSDRVQRTERFRTVYIPGDTVKCGPPPKQKKPQQD